MNKYLIELYNCLYNDNININEADECTIEFVQTIIYSSYEDYIKYGGLKCAKENGKTRQEGKEYLIKDGDVVHFLFNV